MRKKNIRILWGTGNAFRRLLLANKILSRNILYDSLYALRLMILIPVKYFRLTKKKFPTYKPPINIFTSGISVIPASKGTDKPVLFASACQDKFHPGGQKYNGGLKQLNLLIKIARQNGYEGYLVTWDGLHDKWLFDHQPCISLQEFKIRYGNSNQKRCITSWITAQSFIKSCDEIYFWDMELAYTEYSHFSILFKLHRKNKIKSVAGISRTIQAWHMAHFSKKCYVIPSMLDQKYWRSDSAERIRYRVGYMIEDEGTEYRIQEISSTVQSGGLELEFYKVSGPEWEIKEKLQTCNIFLSMNQGKDHFWGEGCPITIIEAMNVGCVVIGYELIGNREIIVDNFNGFIVQIDNQFRVSELLISLYANAGETDRIRRNAYSMLDEIHKLEDRWPIIKNFLDL